MKKRIWPAFLSLALLAAPSALHAQFYYMTNAGAITISGYADNVYAPNVVIPALVGGLPVTSIGLYAFQGCPSLTAITVDPQN